MGYSNSMRLIYTLITLAIGGYGLFWASEHHPFFKQKIEELMDFRSIVALETRFDAQQVMEAHQKKLFHEKGSRFLTPELKFYPFLLLEVKYSVKNKTKEGVILWDLFDGEMIVNSKHWEKTHGFADCILANAQSYEFKILQQIAQKGTCDFSYLSEKIDLSQGILEAAINNCIKKNLILAHGEKYRLHLEKPLLTTIPETELDEQLTTRMHKKALCAPKHFSKNQIERIAKMAFGETFSIRKTTQVYLPVHKIIIQSGDGGLRSFYFNAVTGKPLPDALFYQ